MKKNNLTKIIIAIIVILVVIGGIFAINKVTTEKKLAGEKTISITVENQTNNQILLKDKVFHTNAKTLSEFLTENKEPLKVDMIKQAPYGDFLLGFYGLKTTNMDKGPWWMYSFSSPSEKLDYKVGAAPSIDKINLGKTNSMTFVFTSNMG